MRKSETILVGKEEIAAYAGVGVNLFPILLSQGFPAVMWGGKWRAHANNVEQWMLRATIPKGPQKDVEENGE